MVRRSSSLVVRSETLVGFGALCLEESLARGITTQRADLEFASVPFAMMEERNGKPTKIMEERGADLLEHLVRAGFRIDSGVDGSSHRIDVGGSELIAGGRAEIHSGVEPTGFSEHAVLLSDGSTITADLVVHATGCHTAQRTISELIGEETARRIGHCRGYGSGTPGDPGPLHRLLLQFRQRSECSSPQATICLCQGAGPDRKQRTLGWDEAVDCCMEPGHAGWPLAGFRPS